jgi:hypothetical protein
MLQLKIYDTIKKRNRNLLLLNTIEIREIVAQCDIILKECQLKRMKK